MSKLYTPNATLPPAIIFDIDGTLAHMNNKRGPFEWKKVGLDDSDDIVCNILWGFVERDYHIILMSGRDVICKDETANWLFDKDIPYSELCMRPNRDYRKDSVVKEELFYQHVAPYYNVKAVVDDRPQVIRMWHEIGIPKVICVGNPYIEF